MLWFGQHFTGSHIALVFAAASFCGFPRSSCDVVPTYNGFVRAAVFFACTYDSLRLFHIVLRNLRHVSTAMLCGFDDIGLLD